VPTPLALTGITVHTKSITSNDKHKITYTSGSETIGAINQSYMILEILIPGQVHAHLAAKYVTFGIFSKN